MTTTENNKIIAEFMGWKQTEIKGEYINKNETWVNIGVLNIKSFCYHSDWNWLMEVVEKIFSLDEYYHFKQTLGQFDTTIRDRFPIKEGVYNMCVKFIKWYNQQQTQ